MEVDCETGVELTSSEPDALGADFITVELDTQPIEYVVKWAEVGSKFTISCVKKDQDETTTELLTAEQLMKVEGAEEAFFVPYEEVYPCEVIEQSVEIKTDSDPEEDAIRGEGGEEEEEEAEEEEEEEDEEEDGEGEDDDEEDEEEEDGDGDSDQVDYVPDDRQYRCTYCGKCYSHASSLYRHQQTHTGKVAGSIPSKRPVMLTSSVPAELSYTCPHCGMAFKGSRMLGSHLRLHGKRRIHPCNICGKEFNHSSSLSRHRLVHKKEFKFKGLPKDAEISPPNANLRRGFKSPNKGRKGKRRQQREGKASDQNHQPPAVVVASQGGEKFYACPQCDMTFRTSTHLSKHQVNHVKELLGGYTAGKENLGESSSDLKIRLKLCSRDKPNFYTLCKKNRRRRRRGGGGGAKRGAPPPLAAAPSPASEDDEDEDEDDEEGGGGGGVRGGGMTTAARGGGGRKRGAGSHGCSQCGKCFSHASSLARHMQTHRGGGGGGGVGGGGRGGKFACGFCGKAFHRQAEARAHEKSHALSHSAPPPAPGRKLYRCTLCSKTFMHSSSFSRHKKTHREGGGEGGGGNNNAAIAKAMGGARALMMDLEGAPMDSTDSE